jgi:hypothetical protein
LYELNFLFNGSSVDLINEIMKRSRIKIAPERGRIQIRTDRRKRSAAPRQLARPLIGNGTTCAADRNIIAFYLRFTIRFRNMCPPDYITRRKSFPPPARSLRRAASMGAIYEWSGAIDLLFCHLRGPVSLAYYTGWPHTDGTIAPPLDFHALYFRNERSTKTAPVSRTGLRWTDFSHKRCSSLAHSLYVKE